MPFFLCLLLIFCGKVIIGDIMIFSVLTFVMLFLSICVKSRSVSLNFQSLSCLFESIFDFTIGALTGAVLSFINFIRSLLFCHKDRFNKNLYFFLLVFFEFLVCVNCVLTWQGIISFLPTIGSIIRVYCLWQSDMKLVRLSGMSTAITYGLYYACFDATFLILGYVLLFVISAFSFIEKDLKLFNFNLHLNKNN